MLAIASSAQQLRVAMQPWRSQEQRIALVPTMGNLHDGHVSLCHAAGKVADRVVVTIFVNPTQFGENEDFDSYPRTPDEDIAALRESGVVDAVLVPDREEIYPHGTEDATKLSLPTMSGELCGASRPGHFDGVAGVVVRLLNMTTPDILVLGEKDYQQLILMRWLAADLRIDVDVLVVPTLRDDDGLAMSSRNRYLRADERQQAPQLYLALNNAATAIRSGERDYALLEENAVKTLETYGFRVDYVEVRAAKDLGQPGSGSAGEELIVLGAARLGKSRLIDNVRV